MSIAARLGDYLANQHINYSTVEHIPTQSSIGSAIASYIPPEYIAKAVILEDHQGRYVMAILPANRKICLRSLGQQLDATLQLVHEKELGAMFTDCATGAIPAASQAYNMNAIVDDVLLELNDVYLESGDHQTLIHLDKPQFQKLMGNIKHLRFSAASLH
ncbi:aminoacyl-tRNA deacylase [Psychrobium sp. 1_MG-2023]|uniref:aminoacyl-tRNA deacylase n=1 Tax=Psychrobium sp. 1_MG-2023 TaxID=3062624 RepID=UPI000C327889|nr:YbaK/EbsC family protein [Psychrobium sp. 1_MG-2023]MDP2559742.1 YbaK/EbsC family protein [Psychrobium sp. 1_MG-2023]PKF59149.1 hypothetical protein CW748_02880 [Alteromonadales bacterium alter-6D02]